MGVAICPTSCSTLMGGFKKKVHAYCCQCLATNAASNIRN